VSNNSNNSLPWTLLRACVVAAGSLLCVTAQAAATPLIDTVHTVADSAIAVPVEHQFTIATAGSYTLTLTDVGAALTPSAPVDKIALAVTSGPTIVGQTLTAAGTMTFNATPGTYTVHVVGTPGSGKGSGSIEVAVTGSALGTPIKFSDQLAVPAKLGPGVDLIKQSLSVQSDGTYQVSLTDFQLPQALTLVTLALTDDLSGSLLATLTGTSQTTVTLHAGSQYTLFAIGQNTGVGGLYNVTVRAVSDSSILFGRTRPLGGVSDLGKLTLTAGANYTLTVTDLIFPAAVTQAGAVIAQDDKSAAALTAAGPLPFTPSTGGSYEAYGAATPASPPGVGSYAVQVTTDSGASVLSTARAVTAADSTKTAFSFDTTAPASGTYVATIHDFSFPAQLVSANFVVAQNGTLLSALLNGSGSVNINAAAGPLTLLAVAQADATAGGLFGVNLATPGGTVLYDGAQGVGKDFALQTLTVTTAGNYDLTSSDVGFPENFVNYGVAATQGTTLLGKVNGHGQFTFAAVPGTYLIAVLAQPTTASQAGTYALNVTYSAPTVTLTSSASNVAQGGSTTLTWSSQNADSCTASGGWSGTQNTSGTFTATSLTANTTFTLACTGASGTGTRAVTVTVDPPPKTGGGGGGGLDTWILSALAVALGLRLGTATTAGPPRRSLRS
jgi:hypothetical protein